MLGGVEQQDRNFGPVFIGNEGHQAGEENSEYKCAHCLGPPMHWSADKGTRRSRPPETLPIASRKLLVLVSGASRVAHGAVQLPRRLRADSDSGVTPAVLSWRRRARPTM